MLGVKITVSASHSHKTLVSTAVQALLDHFVVIKRQGESF